MEFYKKYIKYLHKNRIILNAKKYMIGGNIFETKAENNLNNIAKSLLCFEKKIKKISKSMNNTQKYEFDNIVERFLISYVNFGNIENATKKAFSELKFKRLFVKENFFEKLIKCMDTNLEKINIDKPISFEYKNNIFSIKINNKEIQSILPQERYDYLISKSNDSNIAYTIIKYELIGGMKGQSWSIPKEIYKQLIDFYNVSFECFASPFNSQLVLLRDDANYCSIFKSDNIFGSYGSFFDVINKDLLRGKNIVINPPFIESILTEASKYAINHFGIVVFFAPYWKDAKFIEILENKEHNKQILKANKHYYVNYSGEQIMAKFDSVIYVFNSINSQKLEYF